MINLEDLVSRTLISIGHLLVPIKSFKYSSYELEQLFMDAVSEYEEYNPKRASHIYDLDDSGISLEGIAKEVVNVKPYHGLGYKYNSQMRDESWDFSNGRLSSVVAGEYMVDYIAPYTIDYNENNYKVTLLFPQETEVELTLQGKFKKGTLEFSASDGVTTFLMTEDLPSYDNYQSDFTANITSNSITLTSQVVGERLVSGSVVTMASTGALPDPFDNVTSYYLRKVSDTEYRVCESSVKAFTSDLIFSTDYATNPTYLTSRTHGLKSNDPIILKTDNSLPFPLQTDVTYYAIVVDANTIEVETSIGGGAVTLIDNGKSNHYIEYDFLDITDTGAGVHTLTTPNNTNEVLLDGTLGTGYINLETLKGKLTLIQSLDKDLNVKFNSAYLSVDGIDRRKGDFQELFKAMFMISLGNNKAIAKIDGLPFDVTLDDLRPQGEQLKQEVMQRIRNKGKWWFY